MIYFAEVNGSVKIGFSNQPEKRMVTFRSSTPGTAALLGVAYGDRTKERLIHHRWKHLQCKGEWYTLTPELREWIARHCHRSRPRQLSKRIKSSHWERAGSPLHRGLLRWRHDAMLTKTEAAKLLGMTEGQYGYLESQDDPRIRLSLLLQIAKLLDCPASDLLPS